MVGEMENKKSSMSQVPVEWLMPVILTTWEAEVRRINIQDQPKQL
jgi:hypothetical protein